MYALPPQTRIGSYKILKVIARGGFGVTYVAWDTGLERTVVLKECFPPELCVRDEHGHLHPDRESHVSMYQQAMADMRREARTLAGLNHRNIVRVYDVFESGGALYYVMPWLEGGSLRERMDEAALTGQRLEPATVREWLLQLLGALDYLHNRGVLHRDIKPGNIMFDENEQPVLIDFGASVYFGSDTLTQGEFTPAYAAPEQVAGKGNVGPHTDLYALAATWYELLDGVAPEPAVSRLMKDELQPLSSLPEFPGLAEGIMLNLALVPGERNATAADWLALLLEPEEPVKPVRRGQKRSLRYVPVWLGAGLLLAVGCAWWLPLTGEENVEELPPPSAEPAVEDEQAKVDRALEALCKQFVQQNAMEKQVAELVALRDKMLELREEYSRLTKEEYDKIPPKFKKAKLGPTIEAVVALQPYNSLRREYEKKLNELKAAYSEIYSGLEGMALNPENYYTPASLQEAALLPLLSKRLLEQYVDPYTELPKLGLPRHSADSK